MFVYVYIYMCVYMHTYLFAYVCVCVYGGRIYYTQRILHLDQYFTIY